MDFISSEEINIPDFQGKKILFCVLNWGIGHATRSIPIIRKLIPNNTLVLASDGEALNLLSAEFPELKFIALKPYEVRYSRNNNFTSHLVTQLPKIHTAIKKENKQVSKIVTKEGIDLIISDNRYGCHHKECKNFLVTHQLTLNTQNFVFRKVFEFTVDKYLDKFDEVWIPDNENINLSGKLSQRNLNIPKKYIGFNVPHKFSKKPIDKYILFLISGPEPRRSMIISQILNSHQSINMRKVFIQGKFSEPLERTGSNEIEIFSGLNHRDTLDYIKNAEIIVCRSGYSTLIDLYNLKKEKVICIPTLGQPEQEYLANYWSEKGWVKTISEEKIEDELIDEITTFL